MAPCFGHDLAVKGFVARGHQHAGLQLVLAEGVGGIGAWRARLR
jgi:hypothetical protein